MRVNPGKPYMSPLDSLEASARQARRLALGDRGELWALNFLLRRGLDVSPTAKNTRDVDIVARDGTNRRIFDLQVKSRDRYRNWTMSRRQEGIIDPLLFYCFLKFDFDDESREPLRWVVPSVVVAEALRESHRAYLAQSPDTRKDTGKRNFRDDYSNRGLAEKYGPNWLDRYRDAWEQLPS
jgi:hypothetical protein